MIEGKLIRLEFLINIIYLKNLKCHENGNGQEIINKGMTIMHIPHFVIDLFAHVRSKENHDANLDFLFKFPNELKRHEVLILYFFVLFFNSSNKMRLD